VQSRAAVTGPSKKGLSEHHGQLKRDPRDKRSDPINGVR
jgi:hypothetical protein